MVTSRAQLMMTIFTLLLVLIVTVAVSEAGTRQALVNIGYGRNEIPSCSCRHYTGTLCVYAVRRGRQCLVTFADSAGEAQARRNQICNQRRTGTVWASFKCVPPSAAQRLQNVTKQLEQEAIQKCGPGGYIVMGGWQPQYKCMNKSGGRAVTVSRTGAGVGKGVINGASTRVPGGVGPVGTGPGGIGTGRTGGVVSGNGRQGGGGSGPNRANTNRGYGGSTSGGSGFTGYLHPIQDPNKASAIRHSLGVTPHPSGVGVGNVVPLYSGKPSGSSLLGQ